MTTIKMCRDEMNVVQQTVICCSKMKVLGLRGQMEEDNLEDLTRDYYTRPKQVYQGLTGNG
jgi:hypothetical protein